MPLCLGVFHCQGAERKFNWLLVRHVPGARRCVVFFPGDISDFASGHGPYSYSLEGLMWVLCCKFPEDTVVLVKSRMMVDHCAIYVNFMLVDGVGNPRPLTERRGVEDSAEVELEHPKAVEHLKLLLQSLAGDLGQDLPQSLVLVGFSKGASVLNALLRESSEAEFWGRVESVHFVDAGLLVPGVFPVQDKELWGLYEVVAAHFVIWLHATPRQMKDESRPFIVEEHEAFAQRCQVAGLSLERRMYAEGEEPGLDMHFDALRCFLTSPSDRDGGDQHCGFFHRWKTEAEESER
ncbi:unnamed protein product [Polarella glacialis]|uniref:Uncharacterized protein n=1 Tax=Polarella glacialis TaxID=89957 RepID=A0A813H5C6_POLGL|nr:unnamed protein product [Polarella glacialis]CAE8632849.1 unnamed protein product [Polarella glacialis]CAE8704971.1 unnamed protein product [Polarella glacialis]